MELDPLKEKIDAGMYPWAVSIDVVDGNTEVDDLNEIFTEEKIKLQPRAVGAGLRVLPPMRKKQRIGASELWDNRSGDLLHLQAFTVYRVSIDEEGEVCDVQRVEAVNYKTLMEPEIKEYTEKIRGESPL